MDYNERMLFLQQNPHLIPDQTPRMKSIFQLFPIPDFKDLLTEEKGELCRANTKRKSE